MDAARTTQQMTSDRHSNHFDARGLHHPPSPDRNEARTPCPPQDASLIQTATEVDPDREQTEIISFLQLYRNAAAGGGGQNLSLPDRDEDFSMVLSRAILDAFQDEPETLTCVVEPCDTTLEEQVQWRLPPGMLPERNYRGEPCRRTVSEVTVESAAAGCLEKYGDLHAPEIEIDAEDLEESTVDDGPGEVHFHRDFVFAAFQPPRHPTHLVQWLPVCWLLALGTLAAASVPIF